MMCAIRSQYTHNPPVQEQHNAVNLWAISLFGLVFRSAETLHIPTGCKSKLS